MNPLTSLTTQWSAMSTQARICGISLLVATILLEWPGLLGFLPADLRNQIMQVAYYVWKGFVALAVFYVHGAFGATPPAPPVSDAGAQKTAP